MSIEDGEIVQSKSDYWTLVNSMSKDVREELMRNARAVVNSDRVTEGWIIAMLNDAYVYGYHVAEKGGD